MPESAQGAWIRAGSGIELGCGLGRLLRDLRLLPYFDTVVSSAVVGYRKPNPVIFNLACEQMGVRAEASVHVGDRPDATGTGRPLRHPRGDRRQARCEKDCGYERVTALTDLLELL